MGMCFIMFFYNNDASSICGVIYSMSHLYQGQHNTSSHLHVITLIKKYCARNIGDINPS